jgi:hypothetical protein
MADDTALEELTDEELETMLLLCGVYIGYKPYGANNAGWYATSDSELKHFFFSSRIEREFGCRYSLHKRILMLNCHKALLAEHLHWEVEGRA